MDKLELLTGVRELLADPDHWTQDTYARDEHGSAVPTDSHEAVCWCLWGAARKVAADKIGAYEAEHIMTEELVGCVPAEFGTIGVNVPGFNDNEKTTHDDVLKALDCAIEKAKEQTNGKA